MISISTQRLSDAIYQILYKNGEANYKLRTDEFVDLLFVADILSDEPLFQDNLKKEIKI